MRRVINVTEWLDETAARRPKGVAVIDGERAATFAELRGGALAVATAIARRLGERAGAVVALYLPKCLEAVVADIGIIYAGHGYMNLDAKNPPRRTANILAHIQPALAITTAALAEKTDFGGVPVLTVEEALATEADEAAITRRREGAIDADLLCVINTSGSTGTPKGVALSHRSFMDFTDAVTGAGLVREGDVVGSLSPLVFDIYSFELCMVMALGATMAIIPDGLAAFPARVLQLLARRRVSFIFWVPTIMVNMANLDLLSQIPLPDLRMVWFAGEVFPTPKFNYWRRHLPGATFANFYGPIEITLDCLYHVVEHELPDDEPIPIGRPFRNTNVLVLDENDRPAREGELCVRGTSLAMGYYNDPGRTAAAFTQNPLNSAYPEPIYRTGDVVSMNERGELVFRGRKDTLIKHSGYRIELGEIESVVAAADLGVKNCAAVYDHAAKRIALFYEAAAPLAEKELRQGIGRILPRYMVPTVYVRKTELPRNVNGKIDRLALAKSMEHSHATSH